MTLEALAAAHAARQRDWIKNTPRNQRMRIFLQDGGEVVGTRMWIGLNAAGIRQPDGSTRSVSYHDIDYVVRL